MIKEDKELKIRFWPDKILRKKCREVGEITPQIRELWEKMYALMRKEKGIGLAANQVGYDLALIVVEAKDKIFKLANPKIIKKEGKKFFQEGCLSFPELIIKVKRAEKVWIEAVDEAGDSISLEVDGLLAIVFQHEIDHINGIVFIDRLPWWRRVRILPYLLKRKNLLSSKEALRGLVV